MMKACRWRDTSCLCLTLSNRTEGGIWKPEKPDQPNAEPSFHFDLPDIALEGRGS